jgi:hypothetical protein
VPHGEPERRNGGRAGGRSPRRVRRGPAAHARTEIHATSVRTDVYAKDDGETGKRILHWLCSFSPISWGQNVKFESIVESLLDRGTLRWRPFYLHVNNYCFSDLEWPGPVFPFDFRCINPERLAEMAGGLSW